MHRPDYRAGRLRSRRRSGHGIVRSV